jgi:prepilin-type N-terminal cleavage/methylation domain-containing protein
MMKREGGFSLVELMVALAVFVLVIAAATGTFIPLANQFKQQSKMAETNIEGIVGLELLRTDISQAGFGLPWAYQYAINYTEAGYNGAASVDASKYNDAPSNPPRAILIQDNQAAPDYLVLKSTLAASNDASQRWSYIINDPVINPSNSPKNWAADNLQNNDKVIVIQPKVSETQLRGLVMKSDGTFYTSYSATNFPVAFSPAEGVIYGVDPGAKLSMPFNRADYFISAANVPTRCATGTGVLVKAIVSQNDGSFINSTPLLDCVADMQVVLGMDSNDDGSVDDWTNGLFDPAVIDSLTAQQIRDRLVEVRVYILTHEGQYDRFYTFNNFTPGAVCPSSFCIRVGESYLGNVLGRDFDLSAIPNYLNYRWKVYTLVVKPQNLR